MADQTASASTDDLDKPATDTAQLARKWIAEIQASEKAQAKWVERSKKIEKIYNDERDITSGRARKFNILWSNVETLRPAVYMNAPKARAIRRYRDRDPVARLASMLLERCLETGCELYDFDTQMDQAVRDRLLPGRGQVWVFYVPEFAGQGDNAILAYESVVAEYVPWQDFLHSVCRTWSENRWVARRFYKSRADLKDWLKEVGLNPAKAITTAMDVGTENDKTDEGLKDQRAKAQIWEVWDKDSGSVIYVAPGSGEDAILGQKKPPVKFMDFWPCPRPMLATTTSKSLIPTPDYALYQDQAEELNRLTARIDVLAKAMKVAGVYAADSNELASLIEAADNTMIPVKNWAMFAEGGGAKNRIEWFPVEQVAEVLKALYEMREQAKQTLYEVSGIGDILRGDTDPNETATAQSIKSKWGSLRVRRIQKDVQRFAADIMRLKAEVIAEQFKFQSITTMAGLDDELIAKYVPLPPMPQMQPPQAPAGPPQGAPPQAGPPQPGAPAPDPQAAQIAQMQAMAQQQAAMQQWQMQRMQAIQRFMAQVEKLLRDDTARSFRIDVESDSTLEPDQQEEKQTAVEFMTAMTQFMETAAPIAGASPESAKLVGELLLFGVRRFDKVDQLEQIIEQAVEAAAKPKPPQPDPEMLKVQAQIAETKANATIAARTADAELARKDRESQAKLAAQGQSMQLEAQMAQMNAMIEARQSDQELQAMWAKLNMELQAIKAKGDAQVQVAKAKAAAAPAGDAD